jgi:hypothetical protein
LAGHEELPRHQGDEEERVDRVRQRWRARDELDEVRWLRAKLGEDRLLVGREIDELERRVRVDR